MQKTCHCEGAKRPWQSAPRPPKNKKGEPIMTFSDIFKSSFLENVTNVSILDMALGLTVAFLYRKKG